MIQLTQGPGTVSPLRRQFRSQAEEDQGLAKAISKISIRKATKDRKRLARALETLKKQARELGVDVDFVRVVGGDGADVI